ncbi:MAG: protein TolA, partial [Pseudomonadota bacterium]
MHATPPDLNPPAPGHWRLPLALALAVHALLLLALSASVNWQREPAVQAVQAELWAQLPQAALAPAAPAPAPPVAPT